MRMTRCMHCGMAFEADRFPDHLETIHGTRSPAGSVAAEMERTQIQQAARHAREVEHLKSIPAKEIRARLDVDQLAYLRDFVRGGILDAGTAYDHDMRAGILESLFRVEPIQEE